MRRPGKSPRTISNFRCCMECALTCSAGSSRMAIAFAFTSHTARIGFLTSCAVSPSVPQTSASSPAISFANRVHISISSRARGCLFELLLLERRRLVFFVCRSALRDHPNAMLGTQRNRREDFDGMPCDCVEMKSLLNHSQQQRGFHHRKGSANARAWPATKREIRETRNFPRANRVFPPAFGVESFRVGEKTRITLGSPLQKEDVGTRRHPVSP